MSTTSTPLPPLAVPVVRLAAARRRATAVYPGPVGELLARELDAWGAVGNRFGSGELIVRLVDHILSMPVPKE